MQTLPDKDLENYGQLAKIAGFSLHAGAFANADEPKKLERLCRYIRRPAISEQRLRRVFNIDITECEKCHKRNVRIIAWIIDTVVIQKILKHLDKKYPTVTPTKRLPPLRAPPDEQYANDFTIQRDFTFGA